MPLIHRKRKAMSKEGNGWDIRCILTVTDTSDYGPICIAQYDDDYFVQVEARRYEGSW
jgi:hypothetical protein